MKRQIVCAALAPCLAAGVTACGKKGEPSPDPFAPAEPSSSASSGGGGFSIPLIPVPIIPEEKVMMAQVVNVQQGSTLNVRQEPNTSSAVIGSALPGQKFEYIEEGSTEGWRKIRFNSVEGYISADYSTLVEAEAAG